MRELLCCSTAPSSVALGLGAVHLFDIQTGANLTSFNQSSALPNATAIIQTDAALGGIILTAQSDKPILNVYTFQKEQLLLRIVLPEKLSCIATDLAGNFCAAGSSSGRIYLWEIASGILFNSFEAHYRAITVIRFTTDGAALISASGDARVAVWTMARLLDNDLQQQIPTPHATLADHTLAVTDIRCGIGPFPSCRIMTASLDASCKLWDLATKSLLATFLFPRPIVTIALDPSERAVFAASQDGFIHQVNLFRQRRDHHGQPSGGLEAIGGLGQGDSVRIGNDDAQTQKRLISVGKQITSMALSLTGTTLAVGTTTGSIHLYDVPSHQLVRTINTPQGFAITHLATMIKPPDLAGQTTIGSASHLDAIPIRPIASFHRIRDAPSREAHDVPIMLPIPSDTQTLRATLLPYDFSSDHRFFTDQAGSAASTQALQTRVAELEAELGGLRNNLNRAKSLNDAMWGTVVNSVLGPDRQSETASPTRSSKRSKLDAHATSRSTGVA